MIKRNKQNNKGFIALISAIIISAILLLLVTNVGFVGLYRSSNILDAELKEKSYQLAQGCVEVARLHIAQKVDFTGDVVIGSEKCTIESINGTEIKTILINVNYRNYITRLKFVVNATNNHIISLVEI